MGPPPGLRRTRARARSPSGFGEDPGVSGRIAQPLSARWLPSDGSVGSIATTEQMGLLCRCRSRDGRAHCRCDPRRAVHWCCRSILILEPATASSAPVKGGRRCERGLSRVPSWESLCSAFFEGLAAHSVLNGIFPYGIRARLFCRGQTTSRANAGRFQRRCHRTEPTGQAAVAVAGDSALPGVPLPPPLAGDFLGLRPGVGKSG